MQNSQTNLTNLVISCKLYETMINYRYGTIVLQGERWPSFLWNGGDAYEKSFRF